MLKCLDGYIDYGSMGGWRDVMKWKEETRGLFLISGCYCFDCCMFVLGVFFNLLEFELIS